MQSDRSPRIDSGITERSPPQIQDLRAISAVSLRIKTGSEIVPIQQAWRHWTSLDCLEDSVGGQSDGMSSTVQVVLIKLCTIPGLQRIWLDDQEALMDSSWRGLLDVVQTSSRA
jgi:hypothetical protein